MKKNILILLIFVVQLSFGQSVNRQFAGFSIGPSFPLNDFSKALLDDSTSGFAKTGIALNFTYAYRLAHNFGMQLIINYSGNKLDNTNYKDQLEAAHPEYGVSVESTKNWSSGGLFLGPYLRFPLTEKLSWDVRALAGYFGTYSPNLTIRTTKISDPNDKAEYYVVSSRAYNFAYMFGTGVKYHKDHYYILLFGDYVNSKQEFSDSTGWDWDGKPYTTTFSQHISYIAVTAGVGYIF